MKLESYFEFLSTDDIRIKGSRVGIESVLYEYIHRGQTPEAILNRLPSLTLEKIYATILYYLRNREKIDTYLNAWLEYGENMRAEQKRNPPPIVIKLRSRKAKHKQPEMTE